MATDDVVIQRMPLRTSPEDRLNSYNHHSLAPWLENTGYLTPLFLYHRERALDEFNMGRWLSLHVEKHMLRSPLTVLNLSKIQLQELLALVAKTDYGKTIPTDETSLQSLSNEFSLPSEIPRSGFFVRMSHCSPKDADKGDLKPVFTISEALIKIISSKRTVQALLRLLSAPDETDNKIYLFPYHAELDKLSEWRCYIHGNKVAAISQSRFYQPNYPDIPDDTLRRLVQQVKALWDDIGPTFSFNSCVLDVYAEVRKLDFKTRLIEINPWGSHLGSGSLLFHWLDDAELLQPQESSTSTVLRLVASDTASTAANADFSRKEAYRIGRAGIVEDELACLRDRGLVWVLEPSKHRQFMSLPVHDLEPYREAVTTRKAGLAAFMEMYGNEGYSSKSSSCAYRTITLFKATKVPNHQYKDESAPLAPTLTQKVTSNKAAARHYQQPRPQLVAIFGAREATKYEHLVQLPVKNNSTNTIAIRSPNMVTTSFPRRPSDSTSGRPCCTS
ncbi:uncharacterized protein BCR38DRAFT_470566 [Pseudomassariella vexata]|uniref:Uncharacterized protein n=1 Tax=Pseudomassariella vexata TaxID=1141098 RepID=A0A1Y2EJI9_9PEZI|nr:uncharacterized protein BCR38DRAFT_470566 [Pseudomassariella vexata]ORY71657.1 hypothetical protein BCR38DRAFT_470566 [Pseudomassariella vexata]